MRSPPPQHPNWPQSPSRAWKVGKSSWWSPWAGAEGAQRREQGQQQGQKQQQQEQQQRLRGWAKGRGMRKKLPLALGY